MSTSFYTGTCCDQYPVPQLGAVSAWPERITGMRSKLITWINIHSDHLENARFHTAQQITARGPMARMVLFVTLCLWGPLAAPCWATEYYVSGSGSDSSDGLSATTAFRTLQHAAGLVAPGDKVWVMNGSYNPVTLTTSGTSAAWITWQAYPGQTPEIYDNNGTDGYGIQVQASYQVIDGLTLLGPNQSLTFQQCYNEFNNNSPGYYGSDGCNGAGINIDGRGNEQQTVALYHHIVVRNCTIHEWGGSGIAAIWSDYITIEDNLIYDNAWYSRWGDSGVSTWEDLAFDTAPGYHMIIQRNVLYNNVQLVPQSDGDGIIIDSLNCTQTCLTGDQRIYPNRTLVSNNLVFSNGGAGIVTYQSEHIDVVNNTSYENLQSPVNSGWGDVFINQCSDVNVYNNIAYPTPGGVALEVCCSGAPSTNVTLDYNLYFGGVNLNGGPPASGPHDLTADPRFVNPSMDPTAANFRLPTGSPAIDSGTVIQEVTPTLDLSGITRPQADGLSRGAYEFVSSSGPPLTITPTNLTFAYQNLGTVSPAQPVALTNSGNATLAMSGITASGDFAQTNNCGGSISTGASCTINVTFAPTAAGTRLGAVTINDSALGSPQNVALAGASGAGPDFSVSASPALAIVTAGSGASYTLSINSLGGFNQAVALSCMEPASLSCSISPASVTPGGNRAVTATVTVTTTAASPCALSGPPTIGGDWISRRLPFWAFVAILLTLALVLRCRRKWALMGTTMLIVALWLGCGGGGTSPPPCTPTAGTSAGGYTLPITGTASGSVNLSHTQNLTLIVK